MTRRKRHHNNRAAKKNNRQFNPMQSKDDRPAARESSLFSASMELYQSYLPHPRHIEAYEKLNPGSAKTIIDGVHQQMNHRQMIEKVAVAEGHRNARLGIWTQLGIAIATVAATVVSSIYTPSWVPVSIAISAIGGFCYLYTFGKIMQARERREQREHEVFLRDGTRNVGAHTISTDTQ